MKLVFEGEWWLPDNSNKKVKGQLEIFDDHSSNLKLDGTLTEIDLNEDTVKRVDVIHGIALDRAKKELNKITLFNSLLIGSQIIQKLDEQKTISITTQTFKPEIVIIGRHYKSLDEVVFEKIQLQIPELDNWFPSFYKEFVKFHFENKKWEISIGEKTVYQKDFNDFSFQVIEQMLFSKNLYSAVSLRFNLKKYVVLKFKKSKTLKDCCMLINRLLDLFTLAVLDKVHISNIIGFQDDRIADVYIPLGRCKLSAQPKFWRSLGILISFDDFQNYDCLEKWFIICEKLKYTLEYYLSTILYDNLPWDILFFNLVRALEAYHKFSGNFPNGHKKNISLSQRLNEIIQLLKTADVMFCPDDQKLARKLANKFTDDVKDDRHDIAHGSFCTDNQRLLQLISDRIPKLKVLTECAILHELGFSHEEIKDIAKRRLNWLKQYKVVSFW